MSGKAKAKPAKAEPVAGQDHGTAYAVPTRVVVFMDDGSQEDKSLTFRLSKGTGNHVFGANCRIKKTEIDKGFMLSVSVTKVESGDPVKLAQAKAERAEKAKAKADADLKAAQAAK